MQLSDWLQSHPGSSKALADFLGLHKAQVSQWKTGPGTVPPKYMKAVRDFTNNEVTLEDLVPDWAGPKVR